MGGKKNSRRAGCAGLWGRRCTVPQCPTGGFPDVGTNCTLGAFPGLKAPRKGLLGVVGGSCGMPLVRNELGGAQLHPKGCCEVLAWGCWRAQGAPHDACPTWTRTPSLSNPIPHAPKCVLCPSWLAEFGLLGSTGGRGTGEGPAPSLRSGAPPFQSEGEEKKKKKARWCSFEPRSHL